MDFHFMFKLYGAKHKNMSKMIGQVTKIQKSEIRTLNLSFKL